MDIDIKKGDKFLCIRTVRMNGDSTNIAHRQGEFYESEKDGCITDIQGNKLHWWTKNDLKEYYFVPVEKKTVYDAYGQELQVGQKVVCQESVNSILKGTIKSIECVADRLQVTCELKLRCDQGRSNIILHRYCEEGKQISEVIVV